MIVILRVWEDAFYAEATSLPKGEGFENMEETGTVNPEKQPLGAFRQSHNRRYEQWKREDLSAVALETMPKQVNKGKVLDNLLKLHCERAENLRKET